MISFPHSDNNEHILEHLLGGDTLLKLVTESIPEYWNWIVFLFSHCIALGGLSSQAFYLIALHFLAIMELVCLFTLIWDKLQDNTLIYFGWSTTKIRSMALFCFYQVMYIRKEVLDGFAWNIRLGWKRGGKRSLRLSRNHLNGNVSTLLWNSMEIVVGLGSYHFARKGY